MIQRHVVTERESWREKNASLGFDYDVIDGTPYWSEDVCYEFSQGQIEILEKATSELNSLCLELVQTIIDKNWFEKLQIPEWMGAVITRSWEREDPTLYGRFDLAYDGKNPPKLLEYNADTPTSLLESSLVQWKWLQDQSQVVGDQFNSIHERLIEQWAYIASLDESRSKLIHFAYLDWSLEDYRNIEYLMDTAAQAGFEVQPIAVDKIGSDGRYFYDRQMRKISTLFKLYPYEWIQEEEFGEVLTQDPCLLIEPPWKLLLSNKTALAMLWECFPEHPNLLPAVIEGTDVNPPPWKSGVVRKPLYGREGANVSIFSDSRNETKDGIYGDEGFLLQAYAPLLKIDEYHSIIGSWIIGDEPAGMCVREDKAAIMSNLSRFCPHYFV